MKKVVAMFMILLLVASFAGCIEEKPPVEEEKVVPGEEITEVAPPVEEDPATQEISSDIAEVEIIEEDFDISDLEDLESDLDAIVW